MASFPREQKERLEELYQEHRDRYLKKTIWFQESKDYLAIDLLLKEDLEIMKRRKYNERKHRKNGSNPRG